MLSASFIRNSSVVISLHKATQSAGARLLQLHTCGLVLCERMLATSASRVARAMSTSRKIFTVDVNEEITLYGISRDPERGRSKNVALLLHPHPKLGGDANNNVVSALSRKLVEEVHYVNQLSTPCLIDSR